MTLTYAGLRRTITEQDRKGVVEDFPKVAMIADPELRRLSIEAWAYALCCSDFHRIMEIPPEGNTGAPVLRRGTLADHLRGVVRLTAALRTEFRTAWPEVSINDDVLMAGPVCHDVGKPFEFDPTNRARWARDASASGQPTFRHSVFGMPVCLTIGLPAEVAHIAVGHSFEGLHMGLSSECVIIRQADHDWWQVAGTLGLLTPESMPSRPTYMRARPIA